ncbi:hypothetical protein [Caedibacter taeniospiralis]|uniref:hypothetical protein n=1 Tax=Caedibacter taeniospiralis TaxID=28907 RepID=UPI000C27A488|nr:hypothetical protein [Caedibacter taeniospiralis]
MAEQLDLNIDANFDDLDDIRLSGFRLERLEVFNWGTCDKQVWRISLVWNGQIPDLAHFVL